VSETARAMLELVERGWGELSDDEKQLFRDWCLHAHGEDLFLLLRHARRKWTRGTSSSSTTFAAIKETKE
jgi:hypothetical protein